MRCHRDSATRRTTSPLRGCFARPRPHARGAATPSSCSTAGPSGGGRRGTRGRGGRRSCGRPASVRIMPWLWSTSSSTASAASGLEEARPAGARLELRVGREQRRVAADAHVGAVVVAVPVLAGEGPLGAGLAGDLELGRGQALTPLGVGLGELVWGVAGISSPWARCEVNARARGVAFPPSHTNLRRGRRARSMSPRSPTTAISRGRSGQLPTAASTHQPSSGAQPKVERAPRRSAPGAAATARLRRRRRSPVRRPRDPGRRSRGPVGP